MKNKQKKTAFTPAVLNSRDRDLLGISAFYKFVAETSKVLERPLADVADLCYYECAFISVSTEREFFDRFHKCENELQRAVKLIESGLYNDEK